MGTGIQCVAQFYLEGCDWRKWLSSAAWHLASAILALMIMLTPAQAAVETIAPTATQLICFSSELGCLGPPGYNDGVGNFPFHIKYTYDSAQVWCTSKKLEWKYLSNVAPYGNFAAFYSCANLWAFAVIYAPCPVPVVNPTISYVYNATKNMCERTVPDAVKCPVDPFPEFQATDKCSQSLEDGAGKDVNKACPELDPEMKKQASCLADKINRLGLSVPYTGPSATVRTVAYQQHFVDLWKWKKKIEKDQWKWSDTVKQACAPIVAKVNAEWKTHVLNGAPSNSGPDAPHVIRKAVDISRKVVDEMIIAVTKTTFYIPFACLLCDADIPVDIGDVQDYVNNPLINPPPCKLRWGGRFKGTNFDPVHFDLLIK